MKQTAVEWLEKILEGQKDKPFDYDEWSIAIEHAKELERVQINKAFYDGYYKEGMYDAKKYYSEEFKIVNNFMP